MERITRILKNEKYKSYLKKIEDWEADRIFCRHDKKHFLDVARISYILYLEESPEMFFLPYSREKVKEIFYAAGLLHDIGRGREYEEGIEHQIASASLAEEILREAGFYEEETQEILKMILSHRREAVREEKSLAGLFYRADKQSRECFWCEAEKSCDWKKEKKNFIMQG